MANLSTAFQSVPIFIHTLLCVFVDGLKYVEKRILILLDKWVNLHLEGIFDKAGIVFNGDKDCDPQIKNEDFYVKVVNNASLGLGEGYMDGDYEVKDLEEFCFKMFRRNLTKAYLHPINRFVNFLMFDVINLQTKKRAWEVGEKHYNLGNELFESFLDPTMNYSCGYWNDATNLNEAQLNKMDLIGRKLKLKPGMKVLDIGCGWGGLAKHLAENFGVSVVGVTISTEQGKLARERCKGLDVEIRLQDYRDIQEKFDRIVSVGMFEHVGTKNFGTFFKAARNCLTDEGIFLLHTIGVSHSHVPLIEPWFHKYIFPNGILPFHTDIPKYTNNLFILEDHHNLGYHYYKTLAAWKDNFTKNWPQLQQNSGMKDPERFYRMWMYYLNVSAAAFRSRRYQLWQIVLSKNGISGGYDSVR